MTRPPPASSGEAVLADAEAASTGLHRADVAVMRERINAVREAIASAQNRAGSSNDVHLIGVSKLQPFAAIQLALANGLDEFGENYAQEMTDKHHLAAQLPEFASTRWHFIGKLQRNKVKLVVGRALIHTVDRDEVLREIDRRAAALGVEQACLVEVNWGEEQKAGVDLGQIEALLDRFATCTNTSCMGLMTIPPADEPTKTRHFFARLRDLQEKLKQVPRPRVELRELSMGMSSDYVEAVLEGATMVRVGSAIFGARAARPFAAV